jgi:uncharacterized membrane protein
MGFLPLWVLFGTLVVTIGIAMAGGGVLWVLPVVVLVAIVALVAVTRRVGGGEHVGNRTMNSPESRR